MIICLKQLCLNVKGPWREETGSDKKGRKYRSGQMFLMEVTPELHLKDGLELGERGLWFVKTWRQAGTCRLVKPRVLVRLCETAS